jgi:hypothetical protein
MAGPSAEQMEQMQAQHQASMEARQKAFDDFKAQMEKRRADFDAQVASRKEAAANTGGEAKVEAGATTN